MMFPSPHFISSFFPSGHFLIALGSEIKPENVPGAGGGGVASYSDDGGLHQALLKDDDDILAIIMTYAKGLFL